MPRIKDTFTTNFNLSPRTISNVSVVYEIRQNNILLFTSNVTAVTGNTFDVDSVTSIGAGGFFEIKFYFTFDIAGFNNATCSNEIVSVLKEYQDPFVPFRINYTGNSFRATNPAFTLHNTMPSELVLFNNQETNFTNFGGQDYNLLEFVAQNDNDWGDLVLKGSGSLEIEYRGNVNIIVALDNNPSRFTNGSWKAPLIRTAALNEGGCVINSLFYSYRHHIGVTFSQVDGESNQSNTRAGGCFTCLDGENVLNSSISSNNNCGNVYPNILPAAVIREAVNPTVNQADGMINRKVITTGRDYSGIPQGLSVSYGNSTRGYWNCNPIGYCPWGPGGLPNDWFGKESSAISYKWNNKQPDIFKIERDSNNVVRYYFNNVLQYTSPTPNPDPLYWVPLAGIFQNNNDNLQNITGRGFYAPTFGGPTNYIDTLKIRFNGNWNFKPYNE